MKKWLVLFAVLLMASGAHAATTTIGALVADTAPGSTDVVEIEQSDASASNKVTLGNVITKAHGIGAGTGPVVMGASGVLATIADPNADKILGWDDSASAMAYFGLGTGLAFSATPTIDLHASLASIAGLTETNGGIPYGTADNAYAWLAAGGAGKLLMGSGAGAPVWTTPTFPNAATTTGAYLRADGTNFIQSTLVLPNAGTAYRLPVFSATNTMTELAAVGATGQILMGATGAIPAWSTFTLAAPGAAGGMLLSDGTNWTRATTLTGLTFDLGTAPAAGAGAAVAVDADGILTTTITALLPDAAGGADLGSAAAEWGDVYLKDGAVIKGQADQSATLTSSASLWTANNFAVTGYIAIGSDPADAGAIRLPNAGYIYSEADAAGTDISVIGVDSSEVIQIGASGASGVTITPAITPSGGIKVLTPVIDDADNFDDNFTGANLYGGTFIVNAAGTIVLPEPAVGMNFTIVLEAAAATVIDPLGTGTADTIYMNGLAAAADENITSSTVGAMCVFQYRAANIWMATCKSFVEATPP